MDADSFIINIKTKDVYEDIADDVDKRFDTSNYECKIALSSNDDIKLQTFDRITSYPYGTNAEKVCKTEILSKYKLLILLIIQMKIKERII